MARRQAAPAPWQELERQAYDAYREWPLWLMLRERELEQRLTSKVADKHSAGNGQSIRRIGSAQGGAKS